MNNSIRKHTKKLGMLIPVMERGEPDAVLGAVFLAWGTLKEISGIAADKKIAGKFPQQEKQVRRLAKASTR